MREPDPRLGNAGGADDGGNGGNGGEPEPAQLPWSWGVANAGILAVAAVLIVVVLGAVYFGVNLLGYPKLPGLGDESTVDQVNSSVGATLVQWGLALTLVAFVPALILSVLGAFKIEEPPKPEAEGGEEVNWVPGAIKEIVTAVPALLKVPGGFGVVLILLGVLLMSSTALGEGEAGASPSPAPAAGETAPASEAP